MTFLEKLKEFIASIGLLPIAKLIFKKPLFLYHSYIFKKSSQEILMLIHSALAETNSSAWIEFGTFLGATRGGKIIGHDLDIDFAFLNNDNFSPLEENLIKKGFKLSRTIHLKSTNTLVEKTFSYRGANVDFFFVFISDDKFITYDFSSENGMTWGETIKQFGGLISHQNTMSQFTLDTISLNGIIFKCPSLSDSQKHLTELYGENYNIPNSSWHLNDRSIRKRNDDIGLITFC